MSKSIGNSSGYCTGGATAVKSSGAEAPLSQASTASAISRAAFSCSWEALVWLAGSAEPVDRARIANRVAPEVAVKRGMALSFRDTARRHRQDKSALHSASRDADRAQHS